MFNLGSQVTAGAGGMRDAYIKYAEEQMANGVKPLPPVEWVKMIQTQQQLQQQKMREQMQQQMQQQRGLLSPSQ